VTDEPQTPFRDALSGRSARTTRTIQARGQLWHIQGRVHLTTRTRRCRSCVGRPGGFRGRGWLGSRLYRSRFPGSAREDVKIAPLPSIVDPDATVRSRFITHAAIAWARAATGVRWPSRSISYSVL